MPTASTRDCLINISRYVLPPAVINLIRKVPVDLSSGERRITDALLRLIESGTPPVVYVTDAQYFDIGSRQGLLVGGAGWSSRKTITAHEASDWAIACPPPIRHSATRSVSRTTVRF